MELLNLHNLKRLNLSQNNLSESPDALSRIPSLKSVYLNNNRITSLSPSIGGLAFLDTLSLAYNKLQTLPLEIMNLNSTWLDIRGNQICRPTPEIDSWLTGHIGSDWYATQSCLPYSFQQVTLSPCIGKIQLDFSDYRPGTSPDTSLVDVVLQPANKGISLSSKYGIQFIGQQDLWILQDSFTVADTGYADSVFFSCSYFFSAVETGPLYAIKTREGNYAVVMIYNYWVGDCWHLTVLWSYQPNGSRTFYSDGTEIHSPRPSPRNGRTANAGADRCPGIVKIYDIKGRLRLTLQKSSAMSRDLPLRGLGKGIYIISNGNGKSHLAISDK